MPNIHTATQGYGMSDLATRLVDLDELANGTTPPGAYAPAANWRAYAYTIGDDSGITIPTPIDYQTSSDVSLYIRWGCNETYAANSGEVRWALSMGFMPNTSTLIFGSFNGIALSTADINLPATANTLTDTLVGTIPYHLISTINTNAVYLTRVALEAGNNPLAQEPYIVACWLQYRRFRQWQP